jgi:predicted nucleotidyltransferase component of viral defense system
MLTNSLPIQTLTLLEKFQQQSFLSPFYLSGGTALSLYLGHRESEDLDFFTKNLFDPLLIQSKVVTLGELSGTEITENTLNTYVNGVKVQFLYYPYSLLEKFNEWNGIKISSILDIACTKILTVSMRGSKKDFIDVYYLLKQFSLTELLDSIRAKYRDIDYNVPHLLKSLTYFEDAELQPMPRIINAVTWDSIKADIEFKVKQLHF